MFLLGKECKNLREINFSWCSELSSEAIGFVINNCLKLETIILTGLKYVNDSVF